MLAADDDFMVASGARRVVRT
ncbi:hypothetical protein PLANTIT3_50113 [Plantibacter sp. T3]|nr:hypothetical protein PLANTIT3_50113 [Plantibacter sp. T3]